MSYLFLHADDTIIFMDHNFDEVRNMKLILTIDEQLFGLKINYHKSEFFCFSEAKEVESDYMNIFAWLNQIFFKWKDYIRPWLLLGICLFTEKCNLQVITALASTHSGSADLLLSAEVQLLNMSQHLLFVKGIIQKT